MNTNTEKAERSYVPPPYVVPSVIDDELDWFFQRGKGDATSGTPWDPEGRWSVIAYRTIRSWLGSIDDYDAAILRLAYADSPRPARLQRRLGRLTTVVVRLASGQEGWPDDPEEQRLLDQRTAARLEAEHGVHGLRTERRYIKPAVGLLRAAVRAYAQARSGGRR